MRLTTCVELQRWEALDPELLLHLPAVGRLTVHHRECDFWLAVLKQLSGLFHLWVQALAMATPRRCEGHQERRTLL